MSIDVKYNGYRRSVERQLHEMKPDDSLYRISWKLLTLCNILAQESGIKITNTDLDKEEQEE